MSTSTAPALLERIWAQLGGDRAAPSAAFPPAHPVPLPAHTDVASLAWASVAAASLAAAEHAATGTGAGPSAVTLDPDRIAIAYTSERHLRLDGEQPQVWAPLSGFFRAADGWVRTHGNYPHHAAALRRGLGLAEDAGADEAAHALRILPARAAAQAITAAGGLCAPVAREQSAADEVLRRLPLAQAQGIGAALPRPGVGGSADAPLRGIRVLDLTRVIAGPIATRTLALLGADVLRIDPRGLPEPEWQHLDSGHGKRSTLLELTAPADRAAFEELLGTADVVVTGYRARALERLGLDPGSLVRRRPGLVVARLTAWGVGAAEADRRGFDSLVQAASGIAWLESADGERPGALPAQALDHSAGYLIAAGVVRALTQRRSEGGSWLVDVSLRRVAAELLGLPRAAALEVAPPDPGPHLQRFQVDGTILTTPAPAIAYEGGPTAYAAPRRWGRDRPQWRDRR